MIIQDLKKNTYDTDKSDLEKKISDAEKKIPNAGDLAKKTDLNAKITEIENRLCLSLHYNGDNSYLFVNGTEIHNLKQKILRL